MRIEPDGDGFSASLQSGDSRELHDIVTRHIPDWLAAFSEKNKDYGSGAMYELGIRGQYSDIHRKLIKLKRAMWDGEDLKFESAGEVIQDLISHLFLTLHMMGLQEEARDEYIYSEDDKAAHNFVNMFDDDSKAFNLAAELPEGLRKLVQDIVIKRARERADDHTEKFEHLRRNPHMIEPDEHGIRRLQGKIWVDSTQTWEPEPEAKASSGEDLDGGTPDTFPQWLYNRQKGHSMNYPLQWEDLSEEDKEYWRHEAEATTRAYKRGGFRKETLHVTNGFVDAVSTIAGDHRDYSRWERRQQQLHADRMKRNEDARIAAEAFSGDVFALGDQAQSLGEFTLVGTMSQEAADVVMGKVKTDSPDVPNGPVLDTCIRQTETTLAALREMRNGYSGL